MRSLATLLAALATSSALVLGAGTTAGATPATPATAIAATTAPTSRVPVASLQITGARTEVVVHGVRRSAQARWIDGVVDDRLVSIDGCLAAVPESTVAAGVYRAGVTTVCRGGVATARAAARSLVRSKPWYRVSVRSVRLTAFTFTAPLASGAGAPVEAALAQLPVDAETYVEGDDTSMVYVGRGVTQARLDAARAAFAHELGIGSARVRVSPLRLT